MLIIFGAGVLGKRALERFGAEQVICFVDNNEKMQGNIFCNKKVISLESYVKNYKDVELLICAKWENTCDIIEQLRKSGIENWRVFTLQLLEDIDFISEPDGQKCEDISENDWNHKIEEGENRNTVRNIVERLSKKVPLFREIEIETVNRCNGKCSFCPVNSKTDPRKLEFMEESLFIKIIEELQEMQYCGRIALFSNNEPFIDQRIIDLHKYARERLPKAQFHLFTNGTLMELDKFKKIVNYLDELIIDNYDQQLELIPNVKEIKEYIEKQNDIELRKKVKILLRRPDEILTSRGGDAPNRINIVDVKNDTCALPFQQVVIRPSGKVSLCCNDPYGKYTMGDLNRQSLSDIWYGEKYSELRNMISTSGRGGIDHCKKCDTFMYM